MGTQFQADLAHLVTPLALQANIGYLLWTRHQLDGTFCHSRQQIEATARYHQVLLLKR